jgi:hypothetical protein
MINKLCNWTTGKTGQIVLGTTLVLIGVHQFNVLPFFSRDEFGSMNLFMGVITWCLLPSYGRLWNDGW